MGTRRTTRKGSPPAVPESPPLIETSPEAAIKLLEGQYTKIERLDPSDRSAVDDAQSYLLADVEKVFGSGSAEWSQIWQDNIINKPILLGTLGGDDDDFEMYGNRSARSTAEAKDGIAKMLPRIRRLIDRAREHVALHATLGDQPMNPFKVFEEHFQLVKSTGERVPSRGIWNDDTVTVHNAMFSATAGDAVERTHPNGTVERREVEKVRFQKGVRGAMPDAYHLDLRNPNARQAAPAGAPVVNHNTTYNVHNSTVGAVGENATVASSHVIGQVTQWNGMDPGQLAADIAKLRGALAVEASEDDDAVTELSHVGDASKALKANDEASFMSALKRFGKKTAALIAQLGLTTLETYVHHRLGLPPAGGTSSGEHPGK